MIVLDTSGKKLEVVLSGNVTTSQLDVNTYFFDQYPQTQTSQPRSGHNYVATNNTTDVTAVAAPATGSGIRRNIFTMSVYNKDTVQATVTVKIDDGGSERILVKQTLSTGDSLNYEHGAGWTFTSPIAAPFSDTTSIVKGSSDPTKQIRFEVDGLTSATTRVLTVRDADFSLGTVTQAEQETGTMTTASVTPGMQHYHPSAAKVHVNFDDSGNIGTSFNVSSITDSATGTWIVNFTTSFSSVDYTANFSIVAQQAIGAGQTLLLAFAVSKAVGSCTCIGVGYTGSTNTLALADIGGAGQNNCFVAYGDQ